MSYDFVWWIITLVVSNVVLLLIYLFLKRIDERMRRYVDKAVLDIWNELNARVDSATDERIARIAQEKQQIIEEYRR